MKKMYMPFAMTLILLLPACSNTCKSGHTWKDATCTRPKTCSVCGETSGSSLGHDWTGATCTIPSVCSVCGETGKPTEHDYNETGVCKICGATKKYGNSYGYFSDSDLFAMAKDAVENYVYHYHYCSLTNIYIEKVTDSKLLYGSDSFSVVASADFVINKLYMKKTICRSGRATYCIGVFDQRYIH